MLWGEDDYFGRWFQAACAIPLSAIAIYCAWAELQFWITGDICYLCNSPGYWRRGGGITSGYLAYRCLRYAITGRNNINRDDF